MTCSIMMTQYVKNRNASQFSNQYPRPVGATLTYIILTIIWIVSIEIVWHTAVVNKVVQIHVSAGFNLRALVLNRNSVLRMKSTRISVEGGRIFLSI